VIIAGEGELPPFDDLLSALRERAGKMNIDLRVVPQRDFIGSTGD
jgi:hypothetical protein